MPLDNVVFWVFAPIAVAAAIGMLVTRSVVYAALFIVLVHALLLPLSIYAGFIREHQYGLANQTFPRWLRDSGHTPRVNIALHKYAVLHSSYWGRGYYPWTSLYRDIRRLRFHPINMPSQARRSFTVLRPPMR